LECVKELRFGADASYYRIQFGRPEEMQNRWFTIIFIDSYEGSYRTKHFVAFTTDVFELWKAALQKLYTIRQGLMKDSSNIGVRDTIWEKQYWKGAGASILFQDFFCSRELFCRSKW